MHNLTNWPNQLSRYMALNANVAGWNPACVEFFCFHIFFHIYYIYYKFIIYIYYKFIRHYWADLCPAEDYDRKMMMMKEINSNVRCIDFTIIKWLHLLNCDGFASFSKRILHHQPVVV